MHWRKRSGEEMSEEDRAVGAGPRSIGSSSSMSMPLSDGTRGSLTPGLGDSPPKVCPMECLATSSPCHVIIRCLSVLAMASLYRTPLIEMPFSSPWLSTLQIRDVSSLSFSSYLCCRIQVGYLYHYRSLNMAYLTGINPMLLEAFQLKLVPSVSF